MILTTYEQGLMQDPLEVLTPPGTYTHALNAVHQSRTSTRFGLVNEESNELAAKFSGKIKGHAHIPHMGQTLYFVYNGQSEIWLHSHRDDTLTFVCADKEFGECEWGFNNCEFLYGEFKQFNGCNELHVYWSSSCIYHVVNINEMLNEKRKQAIVESGDCSYFDIMQVTCGPHLSAVASKNGGSSIEGGIIQFAIQLETNDGGVSNVFDVSQQVVIETEDNAPGQVGTTSAKLHISNLDKKWNNVIIYVIHTVNDLTVIRKMPSASYGDNGFTFEYYGQEGEIVDTSTIINKSKAWLRGQDMIQHGGRMLFYNIKNEKNLNYQKYANNIELEYVEYEVSIEQQLKYHFPSLLRGEIYAFAIVWKFADGTYSDAYHIPGLPGLGSIGGSESSSNQNSTSGTSNAFGNSPGNSIAPLTGDAQYCTDGGGNCVECLYCSDCSACDPNENTVDNSTTASGGDANVDTGMDDYYNPVRVGDLETSQQFERKRDPSDVKDRPQESDSWEELVEQNVNNIITNEQDVADAADCHDTLYGCAKAGETTQDDINKVTGSVAGMAELLAGYGVDDPDPTVSSNPLKTAADMLIQANKNREYVTRKKPVLNYSQTDAPTPGETPGDPEADLETEEVVFSQPGVGDSHIEKPVGTKGTIRGDNWVDGLGNPITEQKLKVVSRGSFTPYESVVHYPNNKDCDGNFFYPQRTQLFHQVPFTSEKPHFVSRQNGVVNKYQPDNFEFSKTWVRPIGLKVTNIKFPSDDELPKPLCPKSPFKIVYVKRTQENKTIFAKGFLQGIFTGSIYGETQAFGRHGINSFEHVDRFIAAGDDGFSRMGEQSDAPVYLLHSLDTDSDTSFLPVTKVRGELDTRGSGWTHGMWAEGEKPQNRFTGKQRDQSGVRISNNLNHYVPAGVESPIVGFSYAPADSVVTKPPGMQYTLNNRYRPGSLYLETEGRLPGDERDNSFIGSVIDHFFPTECNAPYVSLMREVPDLYGSVDGLKYIDLGLVATQVHGNGTRAIEGVCGDTWIGPYSKRLTSYVSNKKGDFYNPPAKDGSPCRERSFCDSPDDKIFEYMGINYYPTRLPESGDIYDPKNYAGLHTVAGSCGANGLSRTASEAAAIGVSESDYFGPGVCKALMMGIVESHVNPALVQTGEGSQVFEGKVVYPKLKDLYLDADAPNKHPWEKSFLTRFYRLIEQPSKSTLALKAAIRTLINMIIPAGLLINFTDIEAIMDAAATWMISPMLMAFWVIAANTLFTDKRLNQMLGIDECLRDEEGGDLDEEIQNFEDAYTEYNWTYSKPNEVQPYYAFPLPFNTCDCDDCSKSQTNNEIYYSQKQNLDSEIDAYRNVRMNDYNELPAHAGKLQKLFVQSGNLYALTSSGLWALKLAQAQFIEGIVNQQSGTGELLAEPVLLFEGVEGGFAGTNHPNALINTPFGVFFVDDVAKKIYRFTGGIPEEITAFGMQNFFRENLGFCNPGACYDEKSGTGIHYALGYDPRYNRILVTKQDGNECNSFTISYSPYGEQGRWISFHSYKPQAYVWDRNNFFSVLYDKGEVWRHHVKDSYQTFYGNLEPFMVQFNVNKPGLEPFSLESIRLDTRAEIGSGHNLVRDYDITFDQVAVFNSTQGTGLVPIKWVSDDAGKRIDQMESGIQNYSFIKFKKVGRSWNSNEIKDLTINGCVYQSPYLSDCACQVIPEINNSMYDCSMLADSTKGNRIFHDEFLTFRYVFNTRSDVRLYLLSQKTIENESSS